MNRIETFSCFSAEDLENGMNKWFNTFPGYEIVNVVFFQPFWVSQMNKMFYGAVIHYKK